MVHHFGITPQALYRPSHCDEDNTIHRRYRCLLATGVVSEAGVIPCAHGSASNVISGFTHLCSAFTDQFKIFSVSIRNNIGAGIQNYSGVGHILNSILQQSIILAAMYHCGLHQGRHAISPGEILTA